MRKLSTLLFSAIFIAPICALAQNVGVDVAIPAQKLDVAGAIKIGSTVTGAPGSIRYNGFNYQVWDQVNSIWVNLGFGSIASVGAGNGLVGTGTATAPILDVNPGVGIELVVDNT